MALLCGNLMSIALDFIKVNTLDGCVMALCSGVAPLKSEAADLAMCPTAFRWLQGQHILYSKMAHTNYWHSCSCVKNKGS